METRSQVWSLHILQSYWDYNLWSEVSDHSNKPWLLHSSNCPKESCCRNQTYQHLSFLGKIYIVYRVEYESALDNGLQICSHLDWSDMMLLLYASNQWPHVHMRMHTCSNAENHLTQIETGYWCLLLLYRFNMWFNHGRFWYFRLCNGVVVAVM